MVNIPESRKKNSYFPLYWLFNRDPYNGLVYYNPDITGLFDLSTAVPEGPEPLC